MLTVEKRPGNNIKITNISSKISYQNLELYFFIPLDLKLSSQNLSEQELYHTYLNTKHTYFEESNAIKELTGSIEYNDQKSIEKYRLNLSLNAYQYSLALEREVADLIELIKSPSGHTEDSIIEDDSESISLLNKVQGLVTLINNFLTQFRKNKPQRNKALRFYENTDNYISWLTEQKIIELILCIQNKDIFFDLEDMLLDLCKSESQYRKVNNYNSTESEKDINRISNKMRLLRKLIEYPVTLNKTIIPLGKRTEKIVKGSATAIIMLFVSYFLIEARDFFNNITVLLIFVISVIYAFREVLKEDLNVYLRKLIRKGKPNWKTFLYDSNSSNLLGTKLEWLEVIKYDALPFSIKEMRKRSISQKESTIIKYRRLMQIFPSNFLIGYKKSREIFDINMNFLTNSMEKGTKIVFTRQQNEVVKHNVDKRYTINLISKISDSHNNDLIQRWKIIMNKDQILDVQEITF